MAHTDDKTMSLSHAIEKFVKDGGHISIGGFTINRNPMAAVHEIIRQGKENLHLYAHSNGQGVDELVGGGCVSKLEIAYGGSGRFAPTCIRFRKAVQEGRLMVEDYSNFQMTLRFLAGAMGLPFLPTRSSLGSNIISKWGISKEERKNDPGIPDDKLLVVDNPFGNWTDARKLVLVPAIQTDVAIIHVQMADPSGTARIRGLTFADVEQVKASRTVILTCEELVTPDVMRADPDLNRIPPFCVDAVVHLPFGAYPTACFGYYDYDPVFLKAYAAMAKADVSYQRYLETYIHGTDSHDAFLKRAAKDGLERLKATPDTGYAVNLDRR